MYIYFKLDRVTLPQTSWNTIFFRTNIYIKTFWHTNESDSDHKSCHCVSFGNQYFLVKIGELVIWSILFISNNQGGNTCISRLHCGSLQKKKKKELEEEEEKRISYCWALCPKIVVVGKNEIFVAHNHNTPFFFLFFFFEYFDQLTHTSTIHIPLRLKDKPSHRNLRWRINKDFDLHALLCSDCSLLWS